MHIERSASVIALFSALIACGASAPPPNTPDTVLAVDQVRSTCPLGVTNAHVSFDETATGATLTFSTTPENVRELQTRVHLAAQLRGSGDHGGAGHAGRHGIGHGRHGIQPIYLPAVDSTVEETESGARITFTPKDAEKLDDLRAKLKARTEKMMSRCDGPDVHAS